MLYFNFIKKIKYSLCYFQDRLAARRFTWKMPFGFFKIYIVSLYSLKKAIVLLNESWINNKVFMYSV